MTRLKKNGNPVKRRCDCEYRQEHSDMLIDGLRKDGMSVAEVCQEFNISVPTYYNWRKNIKEFNEAAMIGDRDHAAFVHKLGRGIATGQIKGNAGVYSLMVKNVDEALARWVDRRELHQTGEDQVNKIQIEVLPSQNYNVIEHDNIECIEYDEKDQDNID